MKEDRSIVINDPTSLIHSTHTDKRNHTQHTVHLSVRRSVSVFPARISSECIRLLNNAPYRCIGYVYLDIWHSVAATDTGNMFAVSLPWSSSSGIAQHHVLNRLTWQKYSFAQPFRLRKWAGEPIFESCKCNTRRVILWGPCVHVHILGQYYWCDAILPFELILWSGPNSDHGKGRAKMKRSKKKKNYEQKINVRPPAILINGASQ